MTEHEMANEIAMVEGITDEIHSIIEFTSNDLFLFQLMESEECCRIILRIKNIYWIISDT